MDRDALWIALRVLMTCGVFGYFVLGPFQTRLRCGRLGTIALAALLSILTAAITVIFLTTGKYLSQYSGIGIVLWIASAVFIFRCMIKGSFWELLFSVLVTLNLYVNVIVIAKVGVEVLAPGAASPAVQFFVVLGVLLASCPFLWILMNRLYKEVVEIPIHLPFWRFLWLIPALTYLIFVVKMINDYWRGPIPPGGGDLLFVILWSITAYGFFFVSLSMLNQTYKGIAAGQETKAMDTQLRMQAGQYERLLKSMEETARLRHDLRHHLLTIRGFAEDQDIEEIRSYLKELSPSYLAQEPKILCENHVANAILNHYDAMAAAGDIMLSVEAEIRRGQSIKDTDLAIILGNLVENAIEAALEQTQGEKIVEVKARTQGDQLVLMVKNTYDGFVKKDGEKFLSVKHEGEGVGISSVRNVVEKYHGIMNVEYDEKTFCVYVMIQTKA